MAALLPPLMKAAELDLGDEASMHVLAMVRW